MNIELSIIIPTKDRLEILKTTVQHLSNSLRGLSYEIIVVNDSKKQSIELENTRVIDNPNNGAASARNFGASNSKGEYLLFLDDDMIVNTEAITEVIHQTVKNRKNIFLPNWEYPEKINSTLCEHSFGRFLKKINYTSLKGWISPELNWDSITVYEHNAVASYCFCISREHFIQLGGYNEHIPHAGFEDYDITIRLKKLGFKFNILTTKTIIHNENDRIILSDFLERRRRNGITQKKAVEIGYSEAKLRFSLPKRMLFSLVRMNQRPLLWICNHFPNVKILDSIYGKIVSVLIAYNIYIGYQEKDFN